jgi:hypothetical protein
MPKFILIDQSLRDLGGHHYPYAQSVLAAAAEAGWQPVLAVHRSFTERAALPTSWRVHALFTHESYSRHTLDTQARLTGGSDTAGARRRGPRHWWRAWLRRRRAAHFARDCQALFGHEPLERGDLVFLATMSELDLWGLAAFLRRTAQANRARWHLQFHFGIFYGREPDYVAQAGAAQAMRESLSGALRLAGDLPLHLHCTTESLTDQYRSLGVGGFSTLAYPVHEFFRPRPDPAGAPLRIACLGHSRREKGYGQLPPILRTLWPDWFGAGRAQLVLQTHHGRQRKSLEGLVRALPSRDGAAALDFAPFPLPLAGYAALLCGADVGLMLYDPTRYYARCSGVLLEMLCAGVPVLVPAGSWLAAQIEEANQGHLDAVAARCDPGTPLAEDGVIELPPGSASLLLSCRWRPDASPGEFLRLRCEPQQPAAGSTAEPLLVIVGARDPDAARPVRCLLRLPPGCRRVRILADNAWRESAAAPATELRWSALTTAAPMGALGLTIAAPGEIPRLLRDVLEHFEHYRRATREHAGECARLHSGRQVLEGLGALGGADIAAERSTT